MAGLHGLNIDSAMQRGFTAEACFPSTLSTPAGNFHDWQPHGTDWPEENGSLSGHYHHCAPHFPWGAQSFGAFGWPGDMADPASYSFPAISSEQNPAAGLAGAAEAQQPSTLPTTRLSATPSASGGLGDRVPGPDPLQGHGDPWQAAARELVEATTRGLQASVSGASSSTPARVPASAAAASWMPMLDPAQGGCLPSSAGLHPPPGLGFGHSRPGVPSGPMNPWTEAACPWTSPSATAAGPRVPPDLVGGWPSLHPLQAAAAAQAGPSMAPPPHAAEAQAGPDQGLPAPLVDRPRGPGRALPMATATRATSRILLRGLASSIVDSGRQLSGGGTSSRTFRCTAGRRRFFEPLDGNFR